MTAITKGQREYAVSRLRRACDSKVQEYKESSCVIRPERTLTTEQKEALVFAGGVPFNRGLGTNYTENVFDFSRYENPTKYDEAKLKKFKDKVFKQAQQAEDVIMLGDVAEIMQALTDFEKK